MKITEVTGLTFHGSPCTKDCSGHRAGFKWSRARGGAVATGKSQSFVNGTNIAAKQMGKKPPAPTPPPPGNIPPIVAGIKK